MGGGDLNLKKSWHPSTLKNQEKVWKAEKQKAHEDKKIAELQRELREERERESLIQIGEKSGTMKAESKDLNWMYKGPNSHVSREEYLLGRKIDKTFEMLDKEETVPKEKHEPVVNKPAYTIEHEINPEQVIQKDESNIQVDMKRKLLEDPLLMIRQKEESTKRSITSNPVKMKQLEMLINSLKEKKKKKKHKKLESRKHKNSEGHKEKKSKKSRKQKKKEKLKKKKKKHSKKESSSEDSDSSSESDLESEEATRRRKVKEMIDRETKRAFLLRNSTDGNHKDSQENRSQMSQISPNDLREGKSRESHDQKVRELRKSPGNSQERRNRESRRSPRNGQERRDKEMQMDSRHVSDGRDREIREQNSNMRKGRHRSRSRSRSRQRNRSRSSSKKKDENRTKNKNPRSRSRSISRRHERNGSENREEEMKRKREEMMAAAAVRDSERKRNVEKYKEEAAREEKETKHSQHFARDLGSASVSSSVESRIRSKVGSSQRKSEHMNSNFLRK